MNTSSRVALCLYGRFSNRYSPLAGADGAKYIREKILDRFDCDTFVFSTDVANAERIRSEYGSIARALHIEEAPDFSAILRHAGVIEGDFTPIEGFRTAANTLSFLYNRKRSLELLGSELAETPHAYKAAVTCRFDLAQIDRHNGRQPFRVSEINFDPNRNMDYLYSAAWNQLNQGFADQWFYSNPTQLLRLAEMYEEAISWLRRDSWYHRMLVDGVPDSNRDDPFSNEMLLPPGQRSSRLVSVPWSGAVNNHLLHKAFLMQSGLYDRCRFVADIPAVAHVLYTHTDYEDVWPLYFGQEGKYFSAFERNYVLVNRLSDGIPTHFEQIVYDDKLPYVDRLISGLERIEASVVFFDHEDMIVTRTPEIATLVLYAGLLQTRGSSRDRPRLDFVRLIRGGRSLSVPYPRAPHLRRLLRLSPSWIFSIQPSLWRRDRLLDLLRDHVGQHIWDFEAAAQRTARRRGVRGAFVQTGGAKRGDLHWDNSVFPYIATAIVKGQWNTSEYGPELRVLFEEYGVDPARRGET